MNTITSLEQMEKIVRSEKSLRWNGWDVEHTVPNPTAWSKPNGVFIRGRWYVKEIFPITESGWEIPGKFVR